MRRLIPFLLALSLTGCAGGGAYAKHSLWPFGNPNRPKDKSVTTERVLGHHTTIVSVQPQAGDVWPSAVKPFPTLEQVEAQANLPLSAGYTPSLPSPYPPGKPQPTSTTK